MIKDIFDLVKKYWIYLNSDEGLHHVIHFLLAGWIVFITTWTVLLIFAIARELYDLYQERKKPEPNWQDHFWDLCSWMLGGLVWTLIVMPLVAIF